MLRFALPALSALAIAAPSAAAEPSVPPEREAVRCGVLNSLMGVLEEADAEKVRVRNAMALTWFALGEDNSALDAAGRAAIFDAVHEEEGEAVVAKPQEGSARADHLLARLDGCDRLKKDHFEAYRAMAEFLATADRAKFAGGAALDLQGREPPPIPEKKLSFAGGWSFESKNDRCIARHQLDKGTELVLGFNNFKDGRIAVSSKSFPKFDEEAEGDMFAPHNRGFEWAETPDGGSVAAFADGASAASYPGTAIIVDGTALIPFFSGYTGETDGVTAYLLGAAQEQFWPLLKAGQSADIFVLGKKRFSVALGGNGALWAEMQDCIDQYPQG